MATPYKYNRIDLATDAIRLVTLLKGDQSQPVRCEMFETYLHQVDGIPYEALSYVWGTRLSTDRIWLDGCEFGVTENLHEALIHLRRPDEDRVLWVDAICIDQSHNGERGHQVGQMRLVYRTAQRVIIWLGASNCEIDCLFDWMAALDKQALSIARPHTMSTWENQWSWVVWHLRGQPPQEDIRAALGGLLRQEWFSRVWVVQEAALAKSATITCGHNEVNSRAFVVMPSLLNIDCDGGVQARLGILPGVLRESSTLAGSSGRDLLTLLQKFRKSKASDPRDIIYALLGLSEDAHSSEFLRPDYQVSVEEATRKSVAYFMMQNHDLSMETPIQSLPTWNIDEFLASLFDLPLNVFQWATDNAQDVLLYDIIIAQIVKHDDQRVQRYMNCTGIHGPPITIAMKRSNFALIDLLLTIPNVDVNSRDSGGKTPMSIAVEQGNLDVARLILEQRR